MELQIRELITALTKQLFDLNLEVEINRPSERFGDYSSNIALKLASALGQSPELIANKLLQQLQTNKLFDQVSVAGPGFINLKLTDQALTDLAMAQPSKTLTNQVVVAEYSDPNPFKVLHAGHLYTSVIGDSIANLLEVAGATVHRVNFGGDVGLHVAKNVWAIIKELGGELPQELMKINSKDRAEWLSKCYVVGNEAYENVENAKNQIRELNKRLYDIVLNKDETSGLAKIYWTCRQWSYDYFNDFYKQLNINFEKYYPESEISQIGVNVVKEHIPQVYKESQGAVIFDGQKFGLYTNVFINSQGLPTYAAKDVGLMITKWQDYHYDKSVIITANEIVDYMKVVIKSVEQFAPEMALPTIHITHGIVKLAGGKKMSSRHGNILKAEDILDLAKQVAQTKRLNADSKITVGAVKYAFLKQSIGGDIIYDADESVSLEGNSGPYLQYAYARAINILKKAERPQFDLNEVNDLTASERSLVRKLGEYAEIIDMAVKEYRPHYLANYLYELAQNFNRFYESSRVIGDERQALRLSLVKLYSDRLADGLHILGLKTLDTI